MSLGSACFDLSTQELRKENLPRLMALPLEDKILYSKVLITRFYVQNNGKVYVSYSGGKDSTVLLHLVRSMYPNVPAVYCDTGLEYPEIRDHAMTTEGVTVIKPEMSFRQVISEYGYPVVSKNVSHQISLLQRGFESPRKLIEEPGRFNIRKWAFLEDAPFRCSEKCCDCLKKRPAHRYTKETGRYPYVGTRIDEGVRRKTNWLIHGEDGVSSYPQSNPLSIWTTEDVWTYIRKFEVPYSPIYDRGVERTGCVFCMFGISFERERFVKLRATHPRLWEYCMRPWNEGGLGMKEVCEYLGVPTGSEQTNLDQFEGGVE